MMINRKYLRDLCTQEEYENLLCYYDEEKDGKDRCERWAEQEATYGFCDKETWDLSYSFACLIYERVAMLMDIGARVVDFDFNKVEYNGKLYTITQMMQMIMDSCFKAMTLDDLDDCSDYMDDVFDMLKISHRYLWW